MDQADFGGHLGPQCTFLLVLRISDFSNRCPKWPPSASLYNLTRLGKGNSSCNYPSQTEFALWFRHCLCTTQSRAPIDVRHCTLDMHSETPLIGHGQKLLLISGLSLKSNIQPDLNRFLEKLILYAVGTFNGFSLYFQRFLPVVFQCGSFE